MANELTHEPLTPAQEIIAQEMLLSRGDLAKASRSPRITHNAMALRKTVKDVPAIRVRYHELLAEEMQEKGLHIAERILKMAELQEKAFGGEVEVTDEISGETSTVQAPADPKMVIELSKEISRLISEGKGQNMSAKNAVLIATKEDAAEILKAFLDS